MINQDIILVTLMLNIVTTLGIFVYIFYSKNSLSSKIAKLESKLNGHLEWHRGRDHQKI